MKELRLREEITVHSKTLEYAGRVGIMKQWMTDSNGTVCFETTLKMGLFDTVRRKLVEPTEDWWNAIR